MDDLTKIAIDINDNTNLKTDKCKNWSPNPPHQNGHLYTPFYDFILKDKRENIKNVLEIGVDKGGSILMWQRYFWCAEVFGVDIINSPDELKSYNRITTMVFDAYKRENLLLFDRKFDLIIDDGSHVPRHQVFVAQEYIKLLNDNGILIIEDVYGNVAEMVASQFSNPDRVFVVNRRWLTGHADEFNIVYFHNN